MARRINEVDIQFLKDVPLPNHAESYTVISHEFIINFTRQQLAANGFVITDEKYRSTHDGTIAQGVYYLNYKNDPEVGMMFAWSNSYNKQMRFKCAIGGHVFVCGNGMMLGDMGTWGRKHVGNADEETQDTIKNQIESAHQYYQQLIEDKTKMDSIIIDDHKRAELFGLLFIDYEIINTEQASIIKSEIEKPTHFYGSSTDSLWTFYNYVTWALKKSHPRTWMDDQSKLHWLFNLEFDLINYSLPTALPQHMCPNCMSNNIILLGDMQDPDAMETMTILECLDCNHSSLSEDFIVNTISLKQNNEEVTEDPLDSNYGQPENQTNILRQIEEMENSYPSEEHESPLIELNSPVIDEPIETTEEDASHMLYGVDNNPEVVIASVDQEEIEEESQSEFITPGDVVKAAEEGVITVQNGSINDFATKDNTVISVTTEQAPKEEEPDFTFEFSDDDDEDDDFDSSFEL
jgi:hypothetical protein